MKKSDPLHYVALMDLSDPPYTTVHLWVNIWYFDSPLEALKTEKVYPFRSSVPILMIAQGVVLDNMGDQRIFLGEWTGKHREETLDFGSLSSARAKEITHRERYAGGFPYNLSSTNLLNSGWKFRD